jgi:Domain of unknown function (DUF5911)
MGNVDPGPGTVQNPFPPIAEYAFLSDCEVTALVAPGGNIEWLCLPRIDSPGVFASILDRAAGGFRIGPADVVVPAARRYLPGSLMVETTWKTRNGVADRPRRAVRGPLVPRPAPLAGVAPGAHRPRGRAPAAAHGALRERPRRARAGLRAGVRLRALPGALDLRR